MLERDRARGRGAVAALRAGARRGFLVVGVCCALFLPEVASAASPACAGKRTIADAVAISQAAPLAQEIATGGCETLMIAATITGVSTFDANHVRLQVWPGNGSGGKLTPKRELVGTGNTANCGGTATCDFGPRVFDLHGLTSVYVEFGQTAGGMSGTGSLWAFGKPYPLAAVDASIAGNVQLAEPVTVEGTVATTGGGGAADSVEIEGVALDRLGLQGFGVWAILGVLLVQLFAGQWFRVWRFWRD